MSPNRSRTKKVIPLAVSVERLVEFKSEFFKALAHPIRIRILDELRAGEQTVSDLKQQLNLEFPNVSQQLSVLKAQKIVVTRRQGNNIYYSCVDPTIFKLLDVAKKIFSNQLVETQEALSQLYPSQSPTKR
ncbi:MAG: metalloregulator ArsR/SmtB family transcription factor [Candidatus Obscuribacterales bacterium]|nr:metalloregulator ArsR/SmtB family transcription factor [Candidatus Obscuribacterales bacterium]